MPAQVIQDEDAFLKAFQGTVSEYRLKPYLRTNPKPIEAVSRYLWNVSLSEALYPSICLFEIAYRNALNDALSKHWAEWRQKNDQDKPYSSDHDPRWFMDARLMEDRDLREIHEAMERLDRAKKNVYPPPRSGGLTPTEPARVIAELSLGFYVNLYSDRYTKTIFGPTVKRVFKGAPKSTWIKLPSRLQEILALRNRISHHEPIHNDHGLSGKHERLLEMLGWIEPQQRTILSATGLDRFVTVYAEGKGWEKFQYPVEYAVATIYDP